MTTTPRALTEKELSKTSFGIVNNISELFEEFMYCKEVRVLDRVTRDFHGEFKEHHRVTTPHPNDFYFCASTVPQIKTWLFPMRSGNLWVKPTAQVIKRIEARCCEGRIGGFHIIPRPDIGFALITATDTLSIAKPWVAFVPLAHLPEINGENTKHY